MMTMISSLAVVVLRTLLKVLKVQVLQR